MSIIAFDFETEDLVDFKLRSHDPSHPHIVSMALVTYGEDGTELSSRYVIAKPVNGSVSTPKALATHGISEDQRNTEGIPEDHVIALYLVAMARATIRIAHNESFDRRIARIAMTRAGYQRDLIEFIEGRSTFCTLDAAKPIVNLPPTDKMLAAGFTGPKPPSLSECFRHFFNEDMVGAHGALADARGAGRLFWHLKSLENVA